MFSDTISPQIAFDFAIASGIFSPDKNNRNYVGNYMFMGTDETNNAYVFKNIITRAYIMLHRDTGKLISRLRIA